MSKILGIAAAAITLVMALACGGSNNGGTSSLTGGSTTPVYANIDSSLSKSEIGSASLFAIDASGNIASATYTATEIVAGTKDVSDHQATFIGVSSGNYILKVIGVNSANLFEAPVAVVSDVVTNMSKARPKYFQVNALTTMIVKSATSFSPSAIAIKTANILGDKKLSDVYFDGETISTVPTGSTSVTTITVSTLFLQQINSLSMAIIQIAAILPGNAALTNVANTLSSISKATTVDALATANDGVKAIEAAVPASKKEAVLANLLSSLATYATSLGIKAGDVNSMASAATNSSNTTKLATAASAATSDAATVSKFELANSSQGSMSGTTFTLNTLAPVFKITFSDNVNKGLVGSKVSLVVTKTGGASYTLTSADSSVTASWASLSELYLAVGKSSSATIASKELEPGASYTYTLTTTSSNISFGSFKTGTMNTRAVTLTSTTVPFAISGTTFTGLTSPIMFYVNSANAINITTSSANNYGILGTNSALNVSVSPATTVTPVISGITTGVTTATSAIVTFNSVASGNYTVTLTKDKGLFTGTTTTTEITDYPSSVYMEVK